MKRIALIFTLIASQIIFTLTAGYLALNLYASSEAARRDGGYAGAESAGDAAARMAATKRGQLLNQAEKGYARFRHEDADFIFKFSEIGLTAVLKQYGNSFFTDDSASYYANLFSAFTRDYEANLRLDYTADADKFRKKLEAMKTFVDRPPVDAGIDLSDTGEIVRTPSSYGEFLDVDGRFDSIFGDFLSDPLQTFHLDAENRECGYVSYVEPRVSDSILADVDAVLSEVKAAIPDGFDKLLIINAAEAVNKVWAPKKGSAYESFSFAKYLEEAGLPTDKPAPEYDFVASALLHALLISGEDYGKMETAKSARGEPYPDLPGFGVSKDFKFMNSLNSNIVIFAYVSGDNLYVSIAGNSSLKGENAAPHKIRSALENGRARLYRNDKKIFETQ